MTSTMNLSRYTLKNLPSGTVVVPDEAIFELPEKVLQFGTGVLLRGLPDYFIDKANRQGNFGGRIVVIKSTTQGDSDLFEKQDGLFTQCIRGIENGQPVEENIINSSISRVLRANEEWEQVLECAHNSSMQIIISNTTETGIQLIKDDVRHHPPKSFPGKLLAFLYERFKAFGGSTHSGTVIVPTELIPDNGAKLQAIVLELAHLNGLEDEFIEWLEAANQFCNSLVDRIVPGKPDEDMRETLDQQLGYTDGLLTMSEVYRLWAIEGDEKVRAVLSFARADEGVVIRPDIALFRELKLRMLNGTHTLSAGIAYLAGFETVREFMDDKRMNRFISTLMLKEIAVSIPMDIAPDVVLDFGNKVLDRFRNPYIRHHWINITLNYSSKMKLRCIPLLQQYFQRRQEIPELMTLGFAAYLVFIKGTKVEQGKLFGTHNGIGYPIQDDTALSFKQRWPTADLEEFATLVMRQSSFWEIDLSAIPGFSAAVLEFCALITKSGAASAVEANIHLPI